MQCFAEFLQGIQYTAEATKEEIGQRYAVANDTHYRPLMEKHEYIFEPKAVESSV